MTGPPNSNDTPAPEGFAFVLRPGDQLAHLCANDEDQALPLCRADAAAAELHVFLPSTIAVCAACQRIADESSSRPI